jgi:hypothetical protein
MCALLIYILIFLDTVIHCLKDCVIEVRKLAYLILSCFPNLLSALKPPRWFTWHPSRDVGFVLNMDGSCLGDSGSTGFGGLIREGDGS